MAILAYDDVMLRDPRLLVPNRLPFGPVRIDPGFKALWTLKTALGATPNITRTPALWTTTGAPTKQGHAGGLGWYFGSGNYFSSANLVPVGGGAGNEYKQCFCDVFIIGTTSTTGTSAFGGEMSDATDSGPTFFIQNDAGTLKIFQGGYVTVKPSPPGTVTTLVRTYSDFNPYPYRVWADGRLVFSQDLYRSFGDANIYLGTGYGGQLTNGVVLFYALFMPALVRDAEAQALSRNGCELFVPA